MLMLFKFIISVWVLGLSCDIGRVVTVKGDMDTHNGNGNNGNQWSRFQDLGKDEETQLRMLDTENQSELPRATTSTSTLSTSALSTSTFSSTSKLKTKSKSTSKTKTTSTSTPLDPLSCVVRGLSIDVTLSSSVTVVSDIPTFKSCQQVCIDVNKKSKNCQYFSYRFKLQQCIYIPYTSRFQFVVDAWAATSTVDCKGNKSRLQI